MTQAKSGDTEQIHYTGTLQDGSMFEAEARQTIPRAQIPADIPPDGGTMLQMQTADVNAMPVQVADVIQEPVTLDANHPLVGKDLTFEIELVSVE